ncbi:MAG: PxKF domain-containing protein, partial [Phycisphaerales bacterium]|nr:PxKF domain-containing protein [Phycisphaerales bacterium]
PTPPPIKVADLFTAAPGGIGNFTTFGSVAIDPGTVVFEGFSSDGAGGTRKGLYTDFGGALSKLIATGDTLGGRVVSDLRFGFRGFSNHQAVFAADFTDGTHAVFTATLTPCSIGFDGFHPPIGGADSTGGTFTDPVRAFKLKSTVPVKMTLTSCDGQPLTTGVHTIQMIKFSNSTTSDPPIDATPTDSATTGNQFRLTDAATGKWHFNLSTKSLTKGIWQIKATLSDGSTHVVFIELK